MQRDIGTAQDGRDVGPLSVHRFTVDTTSPQLLTTGLPQFDHPPHRWPMRPKLHFHAGRQQGLFTRAQAIAAGYTPRDIRSLTSNNGAWVIVRRAVYMERHRWTEADDREGKALLRALAAHVAMTKEHVLSHSSAGLVHRLPMLNPPNDIVHVTRPGVHGSRTEHGVKHHLAGFTREAVVNIDGVATLDLARTAVDIGREHGYMHGLVACDSARQRGVTMPELWSTLDAMPHWPHLSVARAGVEDSDPGAESVGETLAREFLHSLGLGPVHTQFSVECNERVYFADLRIGRHLVEFDGRGKYQRQNFGGTADRPEGQVLWEEKRRQTEICGQGYGMSRLVWSDFWGVARREAAARVRAEYAVTLARYGIELPPGYRPVPRTAYKSAS